MAEWLLDCWRDMVCQWDGDGEWGSVIMAVAATKLALQRGMAGWGKAQPSGEDD